MIPNPEAAAFPPAILPGSSPSAPPFLDRSLRLHLLREARRAMESHLLGLDEFAAEAPWPPMNPRGVFVTLRKFGQLRGCIGALASSAALPDLVRKMAVAVLADPRFGDQPVSGADLPQLRIELSVLSELSRAADPLALRIGEHGIYIRNGHCTGCFLPQVAAEHGWDPATFLSHCCEQKAGLPSNAWRQSETEVFLFTAVHFGEGD